MGYADKAKAGSGGAIEGEIMDYTFMDTFPFGEGDGDKKDGDNIYMLLVLRKDGVEEGDEENYDKRSLYLGSGQFLTIEEDGKVLKSSDDDGTPRLYEGGEVFKFIASLEEAGFPADARFPDISEEKVIDFRAMIGTRVRLSNEVDRESQLAIGKKKLGKKAANATEEEIMEAGKRLVTKGKHKGKKFNRTYSKVTKVLDVPDEDNKAKAKAGAKAGAKSNKSTGKGSKAASRDEDDDDDNDDEDEDEDSSLTNKQADKLLLAVLKKKGKNGSIEKSALPLAITRFIAETKGDTAERDALRKLVSDEDWLTEAAERGTIEFDASSKKQLVTVA